MVEFDWNWFDHPNINIDQQKGLGLIIKKGVLDLFTLSCTSHFLELYSMYAAKEKRLTAYMFFGQIAQKELMF